MAAVNSETFVGDRRVGFLYSIVFCKRLPGRVISIFHMLNQYESLFIASINTIFFADFFRWNLWKSMDHFA